MKKAYFVYLIFPLQELHTIGRFLPNYYQWHKYKDDDHGYILYGWSKSKKLAKMFMKSRTDGKYFMKSIEETDVDRFNEYIDTHKIGAAEIVETTLYAGTENEKCEIVCTMNEYLICTEDCEEYVEEYFINLFDRGSIHPYLLKNKYTMALDQIGFTHYYNELLGGNPEIDNEEDLYARKETTDYMYGYDMSPDGQYLPKINRLAQLAIFAKLFDFAL